MKITFDELLNGGICHRIRPTEAIVLYAIMIGYTSLTDIESITSISRSTLKRVRKSLIDVGFISSDTFEVNADAIQLAINNEPIGQNEPNDIPIELDGVDDKLSYMKNYFKELHSYPNGDDNLIKSLDALKEACGGFTECLSNFEVNLGEHTIKAKD